MKSPGSFFLGFAVLILLFLLPAAGSCQKKIEDAGESKNISGGKKMERLIEKLPEPVQKGTMSIEEALKARRSVRSFKEQHLTPLQISQILWAAQGVNRPNGMRTCPSAGATYPLETYAVTPDGIYLYVPAGHRLELLKEGDFRRELSAAALGQESVARAPLSVVFCAVYSRTTGKYGDRGVMYVHMEAGHAAQNIHLQAVSLGLGSVPVGAFQDSRVKEVVPCGKDEIPIYIIPVGYPAE